MITVELKKQHSIIIPDKDANFPFGYELVDNVYRIRASAVIGSTVHAHIVKYISVGSCAK